MAITLVQAWQQTRAAHDAARTAAQGDFTAAQAALAAAHTKLDADTAALQALGTAIAANRRLLAAAGVPADALALTLAIRDQIVQHRTLQGAILDDQEDIARGLSDADAASAALARATSQLASADDALAAAVDAQTMRAALEASLAAPPLDTLAADVAAVVGGAVAADAQAEIDASFPAPLQAIAGKRYDDWRGRAATLGASRDAAEVALGDALAAADGPAGVAARRAVDYGRAHRRLVAFVNTAAQRRDQAVAVLLDLQARHAGTKPGLLSASEQAAAVADAARTAAETAAETVDAARLAAVDARHDYDAQLLVQIAADVDAVGTDAALAALRAAIGTADGALATALGTLSAGGDRLVLDQWEAVAQDPAWRALVDFLDAQETLAELQAVVYSGAPDALLDALDAAEDAYAAALLDAAKAERRAAAAADALAQRTGRADAAANALGARLVSAVRGDSA